MKEFDKDLIQDASHPAMDRTEFSRDQDKSSCTSPQYFHTPHPPQPTNVYNPSEFDDVPAAYGLHKIVLMVRDPSWLHAYWDIQENKFYEARENMGLAQGPEPVRVLRVYDVPDAAFEDCHDQRVNYFFDIHLDQQARNWYIRVEPDRTYCVEIGLLASDGRFVCVARSNLVTTPRVGMSDVIDEEWGTVGESYYNEMYALSGGFDVGKSSMELRKMLEERLKTQLASGAVSSFGGSPVKKQGKQRGFWFVLDAELIVYGATEPDAAVTVQGKPIQLRPDGSFTLRFALPDGVQEIEARAVSADGVEERTITPVVTRETLVPDPVMHEDKVY